MYMFEWSLAQPGDIILMREDNSESRRIMEVSKSDYAHAMLYRQSSSVFESDGTLARASNMQFRLLKHPDDLVLLRTLNPLPPETLYRVLESAGSKIGTDYSVSEAGRAVYRQGQKMAEPNRQFCTRYVAQAYEEAGLSLVPDANYCTPQQIIESSLLVQIPGAVRPATDAEIELNKNHKSVAETDENRLGSFLEAVRQLTGSDIQNLNQLTEYLIADATLDEKIAEAMVGSRYLDTWQDELQAHPELYDIKAFHAYFQAPLEKIITAANNLETAEDQQHFYRIEHCKWLEISAKYPLRTFQLQEELYRNLVKNMDRLVSVCELVMDDQ